MLLPSAFLLEEQRSGIYIYFHRCHSFFCALPGLVLSAVQLGHWPKSRICISGQCTSAGPPGAGRQARDSSWVTLFYNLYHDQQSEQFFDSVLGHIKCHFYQIYLSFSPESLEGCPASFLKPSLFKALC